MANHGPVFAAISGCMSAASARWGMAESNRRRQPFQSVLGEYEKVFVFQKLTKKFLFSEGIGIVRLVH
jgi:hypothetical protein